MRSRQRPDERELEITRAAIARALAGAAASEAAADALRALMTLDDEGRGRVSRRVIGCAVLRVRLAYLAGRSDVDALLDAYIAHEEGGAPPLRAWPADLRARLIVERGCPVPLADALIGSLGLEGADAFLAASNVPGPRTLRAHALKNDRTELGRMLADEGIATRPGALSPWALVVEGRANLFGSTAWRAGRFEVQDEASQLVALATGARAGEIVVDLCAGRGGKTLALAAMMKDQGALWAFDVDERALADLRPRLVRAGVTCVRVGVPSGVVRDGPSGQTDVVLVDAPCSSTGVLRRSPDLRHTFSPEAVAALAQVQHALLEQACALARPGGTVVYATCSVLTEENEAVIARAPAALVWEERRTLLPHVDGTDGFFWARARRV